VIDLKTQGLYFKRVSKQLRQKHGEDRAKKLFSTAVYIFSVGGNDYASPFYTNPINATVVLPYPPQNFVDFVTHNITTVIKVESNLWANHCTKISLSRLFFVPVSVCNSKKWFFVQEIYNEGGRKFGFLNVAPLTCSPFLRTLASGTSIEACLKAQGSALARLHNDALPKSLRKLERQLKGFKYSVFNFYDVLLELIKYPSKYGTYIHALNFRKRSKLHIYCSVCDIVLYCFLLLVRFQRGECGLLWRWTLQRRL